jgi:hypothetical protein
MIQNSDAKWTYHFSSDLFLFSTSDLYCLESEMCALTVGGREEVGKEEKFFADRF